MNRAVIQIQTATGTGTKTSPFFGLISHSHIENRSGQAEAVSLTRATSSPAPTSPSPQSRLDYVPAHAVFITADSRVGAALLNVCLVCFYISKINVYFIYI